MGCLFSEVFNGCLCPVGYNVPLLTVDSEDISSYPVMVLNVNEVELAVADNPSEYVSIWNADADNKLVGTLFVGGGAYCFYLKKKAGATPPEFVLGVVPDEEIFVLATEDNEPIEHEEDSELIQVQ